MTFITNCYAWYFIVLAFLAIILINTKRKYVSDTLRLDSRDDYDKSYEYRVSLFFAILVFLPLILIAGLRASYVGGIGDTGLYVTMFDSYPNSFEQFDNSINPNDKMYGWIVFSVFIKQYITIDSQNWLMIIAIISGFFLLYGYQKYTSEVVLCAFLFFASTDFFSWMTNGMRQFMVVSIIFSMAQLLFSKSRKNILFFILIVLLLYNIHSSCLIVIPLYLVSLGRPFNKRVLIIMFLCLLAVVFIGQFTNFLDIALESTDYSGVTTQMKDDDGTNPIRVALYTWPAILAIFFRNKIPKDITPIVSFSINVSLISLGLYIISMFTSGIFLGRLPIYFTLFNYILIPWEFNNFFQPKLKKNAYLVLFIVYFVFFVFQTKSWSFY